MRLRPPDFLLSSAPHRFVAAALLAGIWLGSSLRPLPTSAAAGGQIASFNALINGKLDTFASGVTYKVASTQNNSDFMVTQVTSIKRHRHDHSSEFLYIVSGNGVAQVGALSRTVGPGDMITIPNSVPHAFKAAGAPLRFVEVDVPSIGEKDIHYMP